MSSKNFNIGLHTQVPSTSPFYSDSSAGQRAISDRYYLSSDVFGCAAESGVVLLDLRGNKYYGVDAADSRHLADVVQDWPAPGRTKRGEAGAFVSGEAVDDLVRSLISKNIIQRHPPQSTAIGRSTFSLDVELVSIGDEIVISAPVRLIHIAVFLSCLLRSAFVLRYLPLQRIANAVSRGKGHAIAAGYEYDSTRVALLTCIFRRIRPYIFVANGNCMLHALTLVNYLAAFGEYPAWVLGVRSTPWGAHSWVQHENYLLDTNPAKVCSYDPILSI